MGRFSTKCGNMGGTIKRGNNWISGIAWNTAKPMSTVSENWRAQKPEGTKKSIPICTAADNAMTMERNYLDHDCFNRVMFLASLTLWFHLFLSNWIHCITTKFWKQSKYLSVWKWWIKFLNTHSINTMHLLKGMSWINMY